MCIRDRGWLSWLYRSRYEIGSFDEVRALVFDVIGVMVLASVSYTHLRAHETVLDLVCRLLLENKKATDNNATTVRT